MSFYDNPLLHCPHCEMFMEASYEDGGGDFGESLTEYWTCPECGYSRWHDLGSTRWYDEDGSIDYIPDETDADEEQGLD